MQTNTDFSQDSGIHANQHPAGSKTNLVIAWVSGSLTILLVVFSFVISYNNLVALATERGLPVPQLFPWVVEFAVVVFSVGVLRRSLQGERPIWGWTLVIGSSLTATVFNVIHAQNNLVSQAMHAIPSVFMLLSFETFLAQLKEGSQRSRVYQSLEALIQQLSTVQAEFKAKLADLNAGFEQRQAELDTELTTKQTRLDTLHKQIDQAAGQLAEVKQGIKQAASVQSSSILQAKEVQLEQAAVKMSDRRDQLLHLLSDEGDLGGTEFARRLGTSRATVYNDLNALKDEGRVDHTTDGWTVLDTQMELAEPGVNGHTGVATLNGGLN